MNDNQLFLVTITALNILGGWVLGALVKHLPTAMYRHFHVCAPELRISRGWYLASKKTTLMGIMPLFTFLLACLSNSTSELIGGLFLLWVLMAIALIDAQHKLIPDLLSIPLMASGLLFSLYGGFASPLDSFVGAGAGYGVLWLIYAAYRAYTGIEGMGHGDFKLTAALGAWFGWSMLPAMLVMASLLTLIAIGIGSRLHNDSKNMEDPPELEVPYGPSLAAAGLITLILFLTGTVHWLSI